MTAIREMEAYPKEYVEHNLPLVLLSGLGQSNGDGHSDTAPRRQENGSRFYAVTPECSGERAQLLLKHLLELDGTNRPWNATSLPGPSGTMRYKMQAIGRVGTQSMMPIAVILYLPS